jgi:hypothetical protein
MPFLFFVGAIALILVLLWLGSEFQPRVWPRLVLGTLCLVIGVPIAFIAGTILQRFNDNARFGAATRELVDATINQLEAGHADRLTPELRRFRDHYEPSYETSAERYAEEVREFQSRLRTGAEPSRSTP